MAKLPILRLFFRTAIGSPSSAAILFIVLTTAPLIAQVPTPGSADKAKEANAAFQAGYAAFSNHDLEDARRDFEKVVTLVPQVEEGHSALGAVLLHLSAYPEAISELRRALE